MSDSSNHLPPVATLKFQTGMIPKAIKFLTIFPTPQARAGMVQSGRFGSAVVKTAKIVYQATEVVTGIGGMKQRQRPSTT